MATDNHTAVRSCCVPDANEWQVFLLANGLQQVTILHQTWHRSIDKPGTQPSPQYRGADLGSLHKELLSGAGWRNLQRARSIRPIYLLEQEWLEYYVRDRPPIRPAGGKLRLNSQSADVRLRDELKTQRHCAFLPAPVHLQWLHVRSDPSKSGVFLQLRQWLHRHRTVHGD